MSDSRPLPFRERRFELTAILCIAAFLAVLCPPARAAEPETTLSSAWSAAEDNQANLAFRKFQALRGQDGIDERERSFGEAVSLLNVQPRTSDNIRQSERLLTELASGTDRLAALAAFFLGRIQADYAEPRNLEKARQFYSAALARQSRDPVVETAAGRIVGLTVPDHLQPSDLLPALQQLEPLADQLVTPEGKRTFHEAMGQAYLSAEDIESGLRHLLAADQEGFTRRQTQAGTWVAIAEAARLLGKNDIAADYYRKFLEKFRRDGRSYLVALRLREVEQAAAQR